MRTMTSTKPDRETQIWVTDDDVQKIERALANDGQDDSSGVWFAFDELREDLSLDRLVGKDFDAHD